MGKRARITATAGVAMAAALAAMPAHAQAANPAPDAMITAAPDTLSTEAGAQRALELNLGKSGTDLATPTLTSPTLGRAGDVLNLSPTLAGAIVDLPAVGERVGPLDGKLLDLGPRNRVCTAGASLCEAVARDAAALGVGGPVSMGGALGLDLELEPRAAMRFSDEESSALVGAVVRIGDDLRSNGSEPTSSWYLFAGADAEAMTYAPDSATAVTSGRFGLQDRVIVGDAQAGIGYRIGDSADVSLGYIRRELRSIEDNDPTNDISVTEDAAALSFTWRR